MDNQSEMMRPPTRITGQVTALDYNNQFDQHQSLRVLEKTKKIPWFGGVVDRVQAWMLGIMEQSYLKGISEGNIDLLTGLPLRKSFEGESYASIRNLVRNLKAKIDENVESPNDIWNQPVLMLQVLDINSLKQVNDDSGLGHKVGDNLIRGYGEIMRNSYRRGSDISCRWGGDEFVVISVGEEARAKEVDQVHVKLFEGIDGLCNELKLPDGKGTVSLAYTRYTLRQLIGFLAAWKELSPEQQEERGFVERFLFAVPDFGVYKLKEGQDRKNQATESTSQIDMNKVIEKGEVDFSMFL